MGDDGVQGGDVQGEQERGGAGGEAVEEAQGVVGVKDVGGKGGDQGAEKVAEVGGDKFSGAVTGGDDGAARVVGLMDLGEKVNDRRTRGADDEVGGAGG